MAKRKFILPTLRLSKRSQFVLGTLFLGISLLVAFLLGPSFEQESISFVAILSCLVTLFCMRENLTKGNWAIIILLPVLFSIVCSLFYFILPSRWLSRIGMLVVFSVGFYAILLALNIYVVASLRSIKLLHAARTIGFLLSVITSFGLYYVMFSLHTYLPVVIASIFIISFLLIVPIIWSVSLKDRLYKEELVHSLVLTLILTEIGGFVCFWPVFYSPISLFVATSFLSGSFYTLVGLSQHWLEDKLFKQALWEYLWVIITFFIILFTTTHWGG